MTGLCIALDSRPAATVSDAIRRYELFPYISYHICEASDTERLIES